MCSCTIYYKICFRHHQSTGKVVLKFRLSLPNILFFQASTNERFWQASGEVQSRFGIPKQLPLGLPRAHESAVSRLNANSE